MRSIPFKFFFNPDSIANIIYLKDTVKTFCITMYTSKDYEILVHIVSNRVMKLIEFSDGLYFWDNSGHENPTNNRVSNYYLLSTIADKSTYFLREVI